MEDCLAWMRQPANSAPSKQEQILAKLRSEIQLRQEDITHSRLAVEIATEGVKTAYRTHGKTSPQVGLAATRLSRERVREMACGQVLKQLEDAHHMLTLKEMTTSALGTLKLTGVGGQNLDGLLDVTDTELALVDEARQQIDEIAKCFSTDTHYQDIDDVLTSLGLEPPLSDDGSTACDAAVPSAKTQPIMSPQLPATNTELHVVAADRGANPPLSLPAIATRLPTETLPQPSAPV